MKGMNLGESRQNKSYYVNFCVSRRYTESTDDQQVIITMPADYVPERDSYLKEMRDAVDDMLTYFTELGEGITIKSFSRMDL